MLMNWRIALAILAGTVIGGTLVYVLASSQWYAIPAGVLAGGLIGWLAYAWSDIVREAPHAWNEIVGWNPQSAATNIKQRGVIYLYFLAVVASVAFVAEVNALIISGSLAILGSVHALDAAFVLSAAVLIVACFILLVGVLAAALVNLGPDNWRYKQELHETQLLMQRMNPLALFRKEAANLLLFGRFLLTLFVKVHSADALDCALYAAAGVAIAVFITQSILVVFLSAAFGLGLALAMRWLSRQVPEQWLVKLS